MSMATLHEKIDIRLLEFFGAELFHVVFLLVSFIVHYALFCLSTKLVAP